MSKQSKTWTQSSAQLNLQLFKQQGEYFDIPTSTLTPIQIREKLATLAASIIGEDKKSAVLDILTLKSTPNGGIAVTDDLKYTSKLVVLSLTRTALTGFCFGYTSQI